jgi:hypothetical protein
MNDDARAGLIVGALAPLIFIMFVFVMLPFMLLDTWAIHLLYGWFVQPLGFPTLNYWHVFGLMLLFNLITKRFIDKSNDNPKLGKTFVHLIVSALAVLTFVGIGFLIHTWI